MKLNRRTAIMAAVCLALFLVLLLAGCTRPKPVTPTPQATATPTAALLTPAATAALGTPGATAPAQLTPASAQTGVPTPLPSALPPLPTTEPTAPAPQPTATPAPSQSTYTVQAGDTLYALAFRFGTTADEIAALNGISVEALLFVGQVLQIPSGAAAPPNVHIVQAGENLYRIALKYGTTWQELAELNNITDPTTLYVGQRLVLPAGASGQPTPTPGGGKTYVVKPGDTLYGLARTYGVTVQALADANGLTINSLLYVGQQLTIP
jgi:LysM repeat protein